MNYKNGEEFLNKLYQNMHMESTVMHTAEKSDKPTDKIGKYLNRLENVHDKANASKHKMDLLKRFYYEKYVIKYLPESYIELQKRIAREEGHGDIYVTDIMKEKMLEQVQFDQKASLDSWIEYLSSDDAMYPMWFKNYVFQGMIKLNKFDKEKGEFGKRSKTTTEPYLELNREVLAQVYDTLSKEVGKNKELTEEEQKALENGESFKKLYTYYLKKSGFVDNNKETDGIWIKYNQGDDYHPLWKSIQGKNTGWCTAGEETAKSQLKNGDFYVYYSIDKNGEYTNPRLAIRMDGKNNIGEIRGIGKDQNIEGTMNDILEEKINEFPDKDSYLKKSHDMKLLTVIEKKQNNSQQITEDELQFLYELNYEIDGFGWNKDPRIEEIKKKRNLIDDLNYIFSSIKMIDGDLDLNRLASAEGLKLPDSVGGDLDLRSIISAEGLKLPDSVGGDLDLRSITSAEGLKLPDSFKGDLALSSLASAEGLKLPDSVGGYLDLRSITSAEGLKLPDSVGEDLDLDSLTSTEGLKLPDSVGGNLDLNRLTSAEGLKLPDSFKGYLDLSGLTSAEGLVAPESIKYRIIASNGIKDQIKYIPNEEYKIYRETKLKEEKLKKMTESIPEEEILSSSKKSY